MKYSRGKNLKLNLITGLLQELVAVICGLILPRVILVYFGSTYNGIVNSITQFMAFSVILRSGLGAVTNTALYRPLAEGDTQKVSGIMSATQAFMRKVGFLLIALIIGFATLYPLAVIDEFGYWFSFFLVLIIGAAAFVENMFSIKYKIILQADQKYYVQTACTVIAQILATTFSILFIVLGAGIHVVRIGYVMGLMTTPLMLKFYVDKHYAIDWHAPADNIAIKARWNAFAQQLASIANRNVATVIMTFLVALKEISVYSVYYMVVNNISNLFLSSLNGVKATFGNMIAKKEDETLRHRFADVEWMVFVSSGIVFTTAAIMITPFVLLYTKNVTDVDYNRYWLGILMTGVCLLNSVRIPYQLLVEAAGLFKETRNGAFLEVILNIVLSVVFTYFWGIIGILVGSFVATMIRTTQYAWFSCNRVLHISVWSVVKKYAVYFTACILIVLACWWWIPIQCNNYLDWLLIAALVCTAVSVLIVAVGVIFDAPRAASVVRYMRKRGKKIE